MSQVIIIQKSPRTRTGRVKNLQPGKLRFITIIIDFHPNVNVTEFEMQACFDNLQLTFTPLLQTTFSYFPYKLRDG